VLDSANRIVHGLWVGARLSKLELLTICSFLEHGHEFHLWTYSDIQSPLPPGVVLRNASDIIPKTGVFKRAEVDPECGVGRGSFSSPFSDLFRCKLLYEMGGYWADMDVTCLKPLDFPEPYVFRSHRVGIAASIVKCPPRSRLMQLTYQRAQRTAYSSEWLFTNRVLSATARELGLECFIRPDICNEDSWLGYIRSFVERDTPIPEHFYVFHWVNEFWRTLAIDNGFYRGVRVVPSVADKNNVPAASTLGKLYAKYRI
jgi:hypothetical protein